MLCACACGCMCVCVCVCVYCRLVFSQSLLSLDLIEDFLAFKTEHAAQQNTDDSVIMSFQLTDFCCVAVKDAQEHFTISEVAAGWHELMIPQRIMWPSIACTRNSWTRGAAYRHHRPSQLHSFPVPRRVGG